MIPPKVRDAVWERANSCCERCGVGLNRHFDHSIHHRQYKSRGGTDHITNLVLLCGSGVTGCHKRAHDTADEGFSISRYGNPRVVPILHWSGERRYLLPDGTYGEIVWEAS